MTQTTGLKRNDNDKFYTKQSIVNKCCDAIRSNIEIDKKKDLIIEPSAGNGAFINAIKKLSNNYEFYDIAPEHEEIIEQDYLKFNVDKKYDKIHVISNPPFGRQSSLAIKFIKKSCEFCDTISFILPKSFKKDSLKKHFDLYFHLVYEIDLEDNAFIINENEEVDVPCVFQIWIKKNTKRKVVDKLVATKFSFVKKNEKPDISFRRVGVYSGYVDTDYKNKSIQSHYFIRFNNRSKVKDNIKKMKNIKFEFNNTVGPRSISKQELIRKIDNKLF